MLLPATCSPLVETELGIVVSSCRLLAYRLLRRCSRLLKGVGTVRRLRAWFGARTFTATPADGSNSTISLGSFGERAFFNEVQE